MLNSLAVTVTTTGVMMSLWKHECYRVICDRFTTPEDKEWFEKTIKQTAEEECGAALASEMQEEPYFVDFMQDAPEPTGRWSSVCERIRRFLIIVFLVYLCY